MIRRREFITLLGVAAAAWPLAARAQQPALPVLGYLSSSSPTSGVNTVYTLPAFRRGLKEAGYIEDHNLTVEYRWAGGQYDHLPALAADLVGRKVAVIFTTGNAAAHAAKAATETTPIVFAIGGDPVSLGLVASMKEPEGNVTGASFLSTASQAINLQMLHEAVPNASIVGALINPANPNAEPNKREMRDAARALGLELHIQNARTVGEIDVAFASFVQSHVGGVLIDGDSFFSDRAGQIAALTLRHAIPAIYPTRDFVDAGGLMAYGASNTEAYRLAAVYAGRVLKGEKPVNLPVQQATRVELILNLNAAKVLGITLPLGLLARADEVIE